MSDDLKDWLAQQLKKRRWSQRELSRQSGISQTVISQTISGKVKPSVNFCYKIAESLGQSPETLLRLAGIIPTPEHDPTLTELQETVKHLPPDRRPEALRYLRYLYQVDQDKKPDQ